MTDSGPDADGEDEAQPELCDLCGTVVSDGSESYALVKDSSAIHAVDPRFDGARMVVACSPEHLRELVEEYARRPFVEAELWAGKIDRVMLQHPSGAIRYSELLEETGLTPDQLEAGVTWKNEDYLRWREQFGGDGPEPSS
ncbi:hypothetical protein ACPCSK_34425 [Streptomyces griseoincarnatus]